MSIEQPRDWFFTSDSNHTTAINPVTGEPSGATTVNQKREEAAHLREEAAHLLAEADRILAEADRFDERKGDGRADERKGVDLMAALRASINRGRAARMLREADALDGKDGA